MHVKPVIAPSYTFEDPGTACFMKTVTLKIDPVNGGDHPSYEWHNSIMTYVTAVDSLNTYFTDTLTRVTVIMTSSDGCAVPKTYTWGINVKARPLVMPAITISGPATVDQGQSSLLRTNITNGGSQPVYRWQDSTRTRDWKDIAGASADSLSYTPAEGSAVRCLLTSSAECPEVPTVASNPLIFSVNVPAITTDTSKGIKVYPNPVSSILTVDGLQPGDNWEKLVVRDLNGGRQVLSYDIKGLTEITIPMEGLSKGIYVICLLRSTGPNVYKRVLKL
jgi:hypothetical protein